MLEEALVESVPALVNAPDVGQTGGGTTEASLADTAMAWTLEPELLASFAIGGSTPREHR